MPKFGNKLIDVAKFWIYWIIVTIVIHKSHSFHTKLYGEL